MASDTRSDTRRKKSAKSQTAVKSLSRLFFPLAAIFIGLIFISTRPPQPETSTEDVPDKEVPKQREPDTPVAESPKATTPDSQPHPMDEALRLVAEAKHHYQNVVDYQCLLIKQERMQSEMQPEQVMTMMARKKPHSVALHWHAPKSLEGQIVCYVEGRNNGKMRVRSAGLLGKFGFMNIPVDGTRARKNSRHNIREAGFGPMIARLENEWQRKRQLPGIRATITEATVNGRPCTRVETILPDNAGSGFSCHRSVLFFDKETHLPARCECYDRPTRPGDETGDLFEIYNYLNVKLNLGFGDEVFHR